jgi:hypothetical protein
MVQNGCVIKYKEVTMSNDKQSSSVEWLVEILGKYNEEMVFLYQNEIEQAKAMHKEETIKLYYAYEDYVLREEGIIKTFGQFYNETFGGNNEQQ